MTVAEIANELKGKKLISPHSGRVCTLTGLGHLYEDRNAVFSIQDVLDGNVEEVKDAA